MKWAFLIVAIFAIAPMTAWLKRDSQRTQYIGIAIGALLFLLDPLHLYMAVISWAYWPGFVKGMEVTLLDLLSVSLFLSLPKRKFVVPFRMAGAAYFSAVLISVAQAGVAEASFFYAWQLLRMFFIFVVMTKACAEIEVFPLALLRGMSVGLCFECCLAVWQHFGLGELQTAGTFGHQNALGIAANFGAFPLFALWLAGDRRWEARVGPIAAGVIAVMTASRATLGLGAVGFGITFIVSALRRWTPRKMKAAIGGALLLAFFIPIAVSALDSRFSAQPLSNDYDERAVFQSVALSILEDHPMGIGANNYVVTANTQGYNQRAGVAEIASSLSAHVHNTYLLVAAETGYVGLLTYIILLACPMVTAFFWGWRSRDRNAGDLLLGFGVSLLITYVHSLYEWVPVTYQLQYFLAVEFGVVAGLSYRARRAVARVRQSRVRLQSEHV